MSSQVATEILAQLGGRKFLAMTGAKNLVAGADMLQFDLPRMPGVKVQKVQIKLTIEDTYTVAFYRWAKDRITLVPVGQHVNGVYCDQLVETFEERTGLRCSL